MKAREMRAVFHYAPLHLSGLGQHFGDARRRNAYRWQRKKGKRGDQPAETAHVVVNRNRCRRRVVTVVHRVTLPKSSFA